MREEEKNELVEYRIKKAKDTIKEIDVHIKHELWSTAINRIYYACFYAVTALLLKNDIDSTSHRGTRRMFGLHFVKTGIIPKETGKFYSEIFDLRHTGDYDDFVDFSREDVLAVLEPAKLLISLIESQLHTS